MPALMGPAMTPPREPCWSAAVRFQTLGRQCGPTIVVGAIASAPVGAAAVGLLGVVVGRVRGGDFPGEVRVVHGGLPHVYIAYAAEPLSVGTQVLVINDRGGRRIDVEVWTMSGQDVVDVAGQPEGP